MSWLRAVVEVLDAAGGFKTSIRQPFGTGAPFLHVVGESGGRFAETVRTRRLDGGGGVRGVWSWGEDIAGGGDAREAARAISRVVNPRM
ncbi:MULTISPECIES: hypothetical protein [Actinomadura]|uniref:Uncharacterized protein n=1 Tax=Actinomadura litoris TaxID=2678616 RepID=A0A7K1KUQ7_9ACTN|nr:MULTISPECIES: hypothetical protein [Actinomadura]MBT2207403.1 hypothetical protein [Actinomadura sp. NEAU-AAG7]MUN35787.1 hypothetical protein [Actinomadura litoris]